MAAEKGSTNRADGKRFELALQAILSEAHEKEGPEKWEALKDIARALVMEAKSGNIPAIKEVADRLDGKSAQSVAVTGADGGPFIVQVVSFANTDT